jgi:hypothetical protein
MKLVSKQLAVRGDSAHTIVRDRKVQREVFLYVSRIVLQLYKSLIQLRLEGSQVID